MSLRLYNTLTRRKEDFAPLDPESVRLYVCGPTVYDRAHIGNARPVIVFDLLFRLLRHLYGDDHVRYVRNITDVDDKIIVRAGERNMSIDELTGVTTRDFHADVAALGCLPPTVEPRATEHISDMIAVIERLIASGHAYAADGHVLFDVPSMPDYGKLSNRPLDEMIAGARVEVAPYKRGDTDFVLWKPAFSHEPGWPSPWGRGRPGWHVECSAMSWKHLGETFDIHGGGLDLIFPHHENEIAQSRCAFHQPLMAQVWMHNGFLQVEGEKMSKSLGNFITIHDLLATNAFGGRSWPGDVLRLAMLRMHYRQPIDWTVRALEEAEKTLLSWTTLIHDFLGPKDKIASQLQDENIKQSLLDDLNTSQVFYRLHEMARETNDIDGAIRFAQNLGFLGFRNLLKPGYFSSIIGNFYESGLQPGPDITSDVILYRTFLSNGKEGEAEAKKEKIEQRGFHIQINEYGSVTVQNSTGGEFVASVERHIEQRRAARAAKNWAESDRIRDQIAAMGVVLKDNKDGTTTWSVGRKGDA